MTTAGVFIDKDRTRQYGLNDSDSESEGDHSYSDTSDNDSDSDNDIDDTNHIGSKYQKTADNDDASEYDHDDREQKPPPSVRKRRRNRVSTKNKRVQHETIRWIDTNAHELIKGTSKGVTINVGDHFGSIIDQEGVSPHSLSIGTLMGKRSFPVTIAHTLSPPQMIGNHQFDAVCNTDGTFHTMRAPATSEYVIWRGDVDSAKSYRQATKAVAGIVETNGKNSIDCNNSMIGTRITQNRKIIASVMSNMGINSYIPAKKESDVNRQLNHAEQMKMNTHAVMKLTDRINQYKGDGSVLLVAIDKAEQSIIDTTKTMLNRCIDKNNPARIKRISINMKIPMSPKKIVTHSASLERSPVHKNMFMVPLKLRYTTTPTTRMVSKSDARTKDSV